MSSLDVESSPLLKASTPIISYYNGSNKFKFNILVIFISILIFITCSTLFIYNYKKSSLESNEINLSQGAELIYCKTSCTESCSSYDSVYGKLCCDWSKDSNGGQTCSMHVNPNGVCICSASSDNKPNDISIPISIPVVSPVIIPTTVDTITTLKPHKQPKNDDDFGFEPWMPWDPIEIPADATPCLKHCKNPCGQSQSNGNSYCCEISSKGTCSTTQINGKCYCS